MAKFKRYNGSSWEEISIDADSATNDGNGNNIADTYATVSQIPTKVSSLTNDAGYLTSSNVGDTIMAVTKGTSRSTSGNGYWAAMCNSSSTGSPTLPASGWWHVISMDWAGSDVYNWYSQLALPTQDGGVPHYRRNTASGTSIESSAWHAFITDENISDYANNTTYTLSSSGATVTLTPSSGTAQSVTVDGVSNATNADKATHDSDGNIIASTYVKNTSSQLLSGWSQTFSEIFNKESLPNGIPLLGTTVTGTSSLTGQQITVSTLDFVNLGYATSGKNYAVQKDDNGKLYVNVPWTDTNTTQTTFTAAEYGLHFRGAGSSTYSYGIDLSGYSAGLHFASSNYRITDIETGTISLSSQAFTANTSVSKSVTFHNTGYYNAQGGTTTGAKQGSLRVFLQFVGYNGEQMTCGLISLTDTGFTAYCRCNATLSASSTRYIHWLKVREF